MSKNLSGGEDRPEIQPAPRYTQVVFGGIIINRKFARRPRILRLEPSPDRPKGYQK